MLWKIPVGIRKNATLDFTRRRGGAGVWSRIFGGPVFRAPDAAGKYTAGHGREKFEVKNAESRTYDGKFYISTQENFPLGATLV
jgi:hypothetical protein